MANNVIYRVTGRYMTGSEVTSYHLVSSDGQSLEVSKNKAIAMISRGLIENMRIQYSGDDVIIRGKGTNLNNLPVFDNKKAEFRSSNSPEQGTTSRTTRQNPMAQFKIIKRVMYRTSCVGYVVTDASGKELKINKSQANELALKGSFINADAQKYKPAGENEVKIILRGINCDLKKLPVILIDQNGQAVDTTKSNQEVNVRATQLKFSGILYNEEQKSRREFSQGDYMVCMPNGKVSILKASEAKGHIKRAEAKSAICDSYLGNVGKFQYEFYGKTKMPITPSIVMKWQVITMVK